jgi:hypothetical protein
MKSSQFISIQDLSALCEVEIAVLQEWEGCGLINVRIQGKIKGVVSDELPGIKRIAALYKELGVNNEGIEIILAMRNRILEMSHEIALLQYRLDRLEHDQKFRCLEIPLERGLIIDYCEIRE